MSKKRSMGNLENSDFPQITTKEKNPCREKMFPLQTLFNKRFLIK
jgi:hypothetical protein